MSDYAQLIHYPEKMKATYWKYLEEITALKATGISKLLREAETNWGDLERQIFNLADTAKKGRVEPYDEKRKAAAMVAKRTVVADLKATAEKLRKVEAVLRSKDSARKLPSLDGYISLFEGVAKAVDTISLVDKKESQATVNAAVTKVNKRIGEYAAAIKPPPTPKPAPTPTGQAPGQEPRSGGEIWDAQYEAFLARVAAAKLKSA